MSVREESPFMNDTANDERTYYGCFFCRSGSEERIIHELGLSHPEMNCISPKRMRIRRQGEKELVSLFPGYIFFHLTKRIDFRAIMQKNDVYRLLKYPNGDWELMGSDLMFTKWIFAMGGIIGLSKARFEGNAVSFLSGSLKDYEDRIKEINKRAKTAQVIIDFHGNEFTIWLGFEIVTNEYNDLCLQEGLRK